MAWSLQECDADGKIPGSPSGAAVADAAPRGGKVGIAVGVIVGLGLVLHNY